MEENTDRQANPVVNEAKRLKLAQQILSEVQEGYYQSSSDFFHSIYNELENSSDQSIDIMLRNKRLYD
jgi:hypothetical protein